MAGRGRQSGLHRCYIQPHLRKQWHLWCQLGPIGSDGTLSQFIWGNTWTFVFRRDPAYWGLDDFVITFAGSCGPGCGLYNGSFYLYNDGGTPNDFTVFLNGVGVGPFLVDAGGFP